MSEERAVQSHSRRSSGGLLCRQELPRVRARAAAHIKLLREASPERAPHGQTGHVHIPLKFLERLRRRA